MYEYIDPEDDVYHEENLNSYSWYFGPISRADAEKVLDTKSKQEGLFIIRDAIPQTDPPEYRVSLLELRNEEWFIRHYKIQRNDYQFYIDSSELFPTLNSLVCEYSNKKSALPVILTSTVGNDDEEADSIDYVNSCLGGHLLQPCDYVNSCGNNPGSSTAPVRHPPSDLCLIDQSELVKTKIISTGRTKDAEVWEGSLTTVRDLVAIKTIKSLSSENIRNKLEEQARILKAIQHQNVVRYIGFVHSPCPSIVTRFETKRDLSSVFFSEKAYNSSKANLLNMAVDVVKGLIHISTLRYVHRNVRLSNILVDENYVCKVAGFSYAVRLGPDGYYFSTEDDLTFDPTMHRWMAPESLKENKFSTSTDVWSFSIFLHELFTKGERPFTNVLSNQLSKGIQSGKRLPKSPKVPNEVYDVMTKCWDAIDYKRPSFQTLLDLMDKIKLPDEIATQKVSRVQTSPNLGLRYIKSPQKNRISRLFTAKR